MFPWLGSRFRSPKTPDIEQSPGLPQHIEENGAKAAQPQDGEKIEAEQRPPCATAAQLDDPSHDLPGTIVNYALFHHDEGHPIPPLRQPHLDPKLFQDEEDAEKFSTALWNLPPRVHQKGPKRDLIRHSIEAFPRQFLQMAIEFRDRNPPPEPQKPTLSHRARTLWKQYRDRIGIAGGVAFGVGMFVAFIVGIQRSNVAKGAEGLISYDLYDPEWHDLDFSIPSEFDADWLHDGVSSTPYEAQPAVQ